MTALSSLRIAFIGGGNMARGLIGGLISKGANAALITVAEPDAAARASLQRDLKVSVTDDNISAIATAAVVVLAVKPQLMAQVVRPLAPALQQQRPLVISVAAGIPCASFAGWMGADVPLVRCMPNRPALIGAGATGLYADATVGASERTLAGQVLSSVGLAVWVNRESDIDLVTALSGSGPAYFFRLAELMAEAAIAQGLGATVARQLAAQTLAGAGQLVASEQVPDLARMRAEVTSKGGTTEAALSRFGALGLDRIVAEALQAAAARSHELAEQFGKQP
ncbi:MAG: pyrroline-5-carboxylate reductase [Pseudomonadota bacterium]